MPSMCLSHGAINNYCSPDSQCSPSPLCWIRVGSKFSNKKKNYNLYIRSMVFGIFPHWNLMLITILKSNLHIFNFDTPSLSAPAGAGCTIDAKYQALPDNFWSAVRCRPCDGLYEFLPIHYTIGCTIWALARSIAWPMDRCDRLHWSMAPFRHSSYE